MIEKLVRWETWGEVMWWCFLEGEENVELSINAHQKHPQLDVSLLLFLATPIFAEDTNFKSGHGDQDGSFLELNNMNFT